MAGKFVLKTGFTGKYDVNLGGGNAGQVKSLLRVFRSAVRYRCPYLGCH